PAAEGWQQAIEEDAEDLLAEDLQADTEAMLPVEEPKSVPAREEPDDAVHGPLWQVTGRGLTIQREAAADESPNPGGASTSDPAEEDGTPSLPPETIDRVSRYNFEELSRILSERVGRDDERHRPESAPRAPKSPVVPLSDESLVLNRIPLGILVFRDQDIVFANRALVDLTGHASASALRTAGLAAIIPCPEGEAQAGPVTQLLRADGTGIPVQARLQSVSWQGRPALMLSARAAE